ncbi:hypothetical protein JTB14_038381 [Gonioctena quinquepunctata]|nr:hypothetical protein JTB14_038381 [Gonioctena quinquepunctata]
MLQIPLVILLCLQQIASCFGAVSSAEYPQPRHFNPHPFREKRTGHGPVTFPQNSRSDELVAKSNGYVSVTRNQQTNRHSEEKKIYQEVSTKYPHGETRKFVDTNDHKAIRDYRALAKHGARVLRVPQEKLAKDHIPISREQQKKNYAFSYKVVDRLSGDDFSHSQITNSKTTNGEYRVKLPDGRVQIVSYTADKNGYNADVKYMENDAVEQDENGISGSDDHIHHIPPAGKLHPLKTRRLDYLDGVQRPAKAAIVNSKAVVPSALTQRYDDYESIAVLPSPEYTEGDGDIVAENLQAPIPINVQIYTTNARDNDIGSYVPFLLSSPRPFHPRNTAEYRQHELFPQIIHNGDHGIVIPASTPSSFVLTDQHGQVIDNIRLVTSTPVPVILPITPATPYERHLVRIASTLAPHVGYK